MSRKTIKEDKQGVSSVVGSILMVGIVMTMMCTIMLMTNMQNNANMEVTKANVKLIQKFVDYVDSLQIGNSVGNVPTTFRRGSNISSSLGGDPSLFVNHAPVIMSVDPHDNEKNVDLQPVCTVGICDVDGDELRVSFYYKVPSNTSFSSDWTLDRIITVPSLTNLTEVSWQYTQAVEMNKAYYWMVDVTDGDYETVGIFSFVTLVPPGYP